MADGVDEEEKELTAKQKRNKKKKEAAKRKKQEKQKGAEHFKLEEKERETNQTPEEKFEQELAWCIEKMELGLLTQKADKKLATHTGHLIKSLKSSKTAMPRKRQIMFSVFGDYRRKMQEDFQKTNQEAATKPGVSAVKPTEQKSVFVKVCHSTQQSPTVAEASENSSTEQSWKFAASNNSFRFEF